MVKLSGILEYSMGGFLCLRGFASFKMLSAISEPNPEVQRDLIAQHQGEMATKSICFIRNCALDKPGIDLLGDSKLVFPRMLQRMS